MVATRPAKGSIKPQDLISPDLSEFARRYAFPERIVNVYLHQQTGTTAVSGGIYGAQDIETVAFDQSFKDFAQQFFKRLEQKIDWRVQFVDQPDQANIRYYIDRKIDVGDSGGQSTVGITLTNQTRKGNFFEVMLSADLMQDPVFARFAFVHETGHVAGLEHPFDGSDGDFHLSTNPWSGADVSETAMAYRSNSGLFDVTDFTSDDITALQTIWGAKPVSRQPVATQTVATQTVATQPVASRPPTPSSPSKDTVTGLPTTKRAAPSRPAITPRTNRSTTPVSKASQQPARKPVPRSFAKTTPASSRRLETPWRSDLQAFQPWSGADPFPSREPWLPATWLGG